MFQGQGRPTICPRGQGLDMDEAKEQAQILKDAMVGFGTSEGKIIQVLAAHNSDQRQDILKMYAGYGCDLIEDLKGELGGDLEDACVALLTPIDDLDAKYLHEAIKGAGTCENTLTGILCTRNDDELELIKERYEALYECTLAEDLQGDVSGNFGKLCLGLVNSGHSGDDDEDLAAEEAQTLQEAGIGSLGTNEEHFGFIFCNSNPQQLRHIMRKYEENTGNNLCDDIESEFSGPLKEGYLAMLKCAYNRPKYFAERLYKAMNKCGTDEHEVMRILVSRAEIDLEDIKECYVELSGGTPLVEEICNEFSGDIERCLKSIVEGRYTE